MPRPELGAADDTIKLFVGDGPVPLYESYEVQMSVLQQPAAFTLRLGWGLESSDLLARCVPGLPFELRVAGVVIQSGKLDGRRLKVDSSGSFIEFKGRDWTAAVFDSFVLEDRTFAEATYYDLCRKVLDICGLADRGLVADDAAQVKAITGTQTVRVVNEQAVRDIETGAKDAGSSKVVSRTLKAKLGERWYDWLQRQLKLAGLFLWCTGEGNFVLARPNGDQDPGYTISRNRSNDPRNDFSDVIAVEWNDDTTSRHSKAIVYGRSFTAKGGQHQLKGEFVDDDMVALGFSKAITIHDQDVTTSAQAEYVARRTIAEERRAGWTLRYTVPGHTVAGLLSANGLAIWGPDTTVRVDDSELGLFGAYYLEHITFRRDASAGTSTELVLMRPEDLVFAQLAKAGKARKPRTNKIRG